MVRNLLGENAFFVGMRLMSIVLAQAIILVLAFKLDAENFGRFSLVFAVSQITMIVSSGWTSGLILNHGQRDIANNRSPLRLVLFRIVFCAGISVFAVLLANSFQIELADFLSFPEAIFCLYCFTIAEIAYDQTQSLLEMVGNPVAGASLAAGLKGVVFFYVAIGDVTLGDYAQFYALCHVSYALIVAVLFLLSEGRSNREPSQLPIKDILIYSIGALSTAIAVAGVNNMSAIMIRGHGYGFEEIGAHSLAFRLVSGFLVFSFFVRYYYPKLLYAKLAEDVPAFVRDVTSRTLYVYALACLVVYWVVGAFLEIALVQTLPGYGSFRNYYLLYSPVVALLAASSFLSVIYQNSSHYARDNLFYVAMTIVIALGSIILGKFSIYGVVISYLLGYFLYFCLQRIFVNSTFFNAVTNWHTR